MKSVIEFEGDEPIVIEEWPELTYIVHPADDLEGVWIGHCLELDVVSQGDGPEEALKMVMEATAITQEWYRRDGRDSWASSAPSEYWPPERLELWQERRKQLRRLRVVEDK